uniref:Uncharacterized protein n=1 Tax=Glossina austeni TaxID=7395 RepID=A0A1A9UD47_GLOAU
MPNPFDNTTIQPGVIAVTNYHNFGAAVLKRGSSTKKYNPTINTLQDFRFIFIIIDIPKVIIAANFLGKLEQLVDVIRKELVNPSTSLPMNALAVHCNVLSPKLFGMENRHTKLLQEFPSLTQQPDYFSPAKPAMSPEWLQ